MESVREQLEVSQGVRGSSLDQSVTFGDIIDIGLASFRSRGRTQFNATDLMPSSEAPNLTIPPAPAFVEGIAGIGFNTITFQIPLYGNHGFAEIWRAEGAGALLGAAVRIGTTNSTVYSDFDVVEGTVYVYWVRFISTSSIAGPYHASLGVELTSKFSAAKIFDSLEETLMDLSGDNIFQVIAENFALWDPGPNYETNPNDKALVIGYSGGQLGIDGAYIKTATIDDASIFGLTAAKITAGELTAGTWIKGGDFFGGQLRLGGGNIVRDNETGIPTGYASVIDSDGRAWFEYAYVRGDIEASSIRGGKTGANDTTPGYFLGFDGSTPEVNIGNSSNKLHWNGSSLVVRGDIQATSLTADTVNTDKLITGAINVSGAWSMSGSSSSPGPPHYQYHSKYHLNFLGALDNGARVIIFHELSGDNALVTLEVGAWDGYSFSGYTHLSTKAFGISGTNLAQIGAVYDLPNNAIILRFRLTVIALVNRWGSGSGTGSSSGDYVVIKK
jgi:hypothetical protein